MATSWSPHWRAMIAKLRRMIAEPTANPYTDEILTGILEKYPVPDAEGHFPDDDDWEATYDLNMAAADVWQEKAAALAQFYDFSADGGSYKRSQQQEQALKQASYYQRRRHASTRPSIKSPAERNTYFSFLCGSGLDDGIYVN